MADEQQKQVDDSEFLEITRDPARARVMRTALEQIAAGGRAGPLKEMAEEVLSGRLGLRQATTISAYADPLIEEFQTFKQEWDSLSEKEREERAAEGARYIEDQRQELDAPHGAAHTGSGRSTKARHHGSGWSL
ncbi:hypothetical protein TPA0598_04_05290 [Streptomyces lydicamycinicus]|uniref:Uncharacterized protein n=1 Tax=Streptomyces lydicamycinicus TaxID=1546107 RepID=A0A0P4R6U2_9ACTN|nr:hypothetical protein [Streptomyces lydicamycinicus]GAO08893.1 hypothetical protein TPA0598_04_05290 [Streptomyces lydicamycinicus]